MEVYTDMNKQAPFSLAPSIFLPFKGFSPGDAPVLDQTQKLQNILQNLAEQQAMVRGNMICMVEQRGRALKANAKKELDEMEGDYGDDSGDPEERRRLRSEIDAMFQRIKIPSRKDAKSEDFEVKPGHFKPFHGNEIANPAQANGDVAMGGTEVNPKPRTARMVLESLSRDLLEIVDRAAAEMEGYDKHAEETINPYRQALDRRIGKHVPTTVAASISGGILKNRNEQSPIDMSAVRRVSTGMPIVGLPAAAPTK
jgi:hypothetical protein